MFGRGIAEWEVRPRWLGVAGWEVLCDGHRQAIFSSRCMAIKDAETACMFFWEKLGENSKLEVKNFRNEVVLSKIFG